MTYSCFNDHWEVCRSSDNSALAVTLPHDAMIWEGRSADAPSGPHAAFFLGGSYHYRKVWFAPLQLEGSFIWLLFEGVYHHSRVLINGQDVGGAIGGYIEFECRIDGALRFGAENLIEVTVDNTELPNARWYTGSGIYRPVWLHVTDAIHIERDGLRFQGFSNGQPGRAEVCVKMFNPHAAELDILVVVECDHVEAARGGARTMQDAARIPIEVSSPQLWSARNPILYNCTVRVSTSGRLCDERHVKVGLRTIEMSGRNGLQVNGQPVLLRGANIHHDNGVLGAATFRDAEYRRVRVLKHTGFNAIRSAHSPASRALLDACDELGMYVMDEPFDNWYDHKTERDDAPHFAATWRDEIDAMVAKDRNHPCVIMYSIGNENSEPASAYGLETARQMAARVRALDPERAVTAGVNLMSASLGWPSKRKGSTTMQPVGKRAPNMNSTTVNAVANQFTRLMKLAPRLPRTDTVTRDMFALLDVAGYNYGTVRYERDAILHPHRVIVGTETVPGDIVKNWNLVEGVQNVIGDFTWSGWDYLGEAGIGTWQYGAQRTRLLKAYPQLVAGCGAIDIIGVPGASALLAKAAWGMLDRPAITVRPLNVSGIKARKTAWRSTDAVASWAWRGCEDRKAEIEVISCDDEVEVLVNNRSLGRRKAGRRAGCIARFRTTYEPGEITAIGYRHGAAKGRTTLRSAGSVRLRLIAETLELAPNGQALCFLRIELADDAGVVEMLDDDVVRVSVAGPATLAGFGSAAPVTTEAFCDHEHSTYRGRALAVVRAGMAPGTIRVTAVSRRHGDASLTVEQLHKD